MGPRIEEPPFDPDSPGGPSEKRLRCQPREGGLVYPWAADHTHAMAGGVPGLEGWQAQGRQVAARSGH